MSKKANSQNSINQQAQLYISHVIGVAAEAVQVTHGNQSQVTTKVHLPLGRDMKALVARCKSAVKGRLERYTDHNGISFCVNFEGTKRVSFYQRWTDYDTIEVSVIQF